MQRLELMPICYGIVYVEYAGGNIGEGGIENKNEVYNEDEPAKDGSRRRTEGSPLPS